MILNKSISNTETRTHVILPAVIVEKIDARCGPRQRSKFLAAVAEREIARLDLLEAAEAAAGSIPDGMVPEWDTSESTAAWVHDLRAESNERLDRVHRQRG